MVELRCPAHGLPLSGVPTRYGVRWYCPEAGCTVVCWGGKTSTPADAETRTLRSRCHEAFDPLWRGGTQGKRRWKGRQTAYLWLQRHMNLSAEEAHIGRFNKAQCLQLLALLQPSEEMRL